MELIYLLPVASLVLWFIYHITQDDDYRQGDSLGILMVILIVLGIALWNWLIANV
jgi:hypothetical protein